MYTLRRSDGERVVLSLKDYAEMVEIGAAIERGIYDSQHSGAQAQIAAGRSLAYGPFRIDQHTISVGNDTVAWSDVVELVVRNGTIGVRTARWERTYPMSHIGNLAVFAALAEQLWREAATR